MASKGYSPETRAIFDAMSRRMVAFYPALAVALDSIPAAIMLGQLLYWHGKQKDPDGWIRKSAAEMEEETAVTARQQEYARPVLTEKGLIQYERRGVPAMGHYKIDHDKIIDLLIESDARQLRQNVGTELRQNVGTSSTRRSGVQLRQNVVTDTETTTEITAESTADATTAAARAAGIGSQPSQRIARNKTNRLAAASRMDELERHPAIAAHRRVCGIQPMTLEQAEMIVSRVNGTAETTWPVDLVAWVQGTRKDGQPFNLAAIERQLQWHTDAETRRKVRSPAASAPTLSESEYAELTAKMEAPL